MNCPENLEQAYSSKASRGVLQIGAFSHFWGSRTLLMGILNVTPDSFSGDGTIASDEAVSRALELLVAGADIIDIGGESTRPGHHPVASDEEIRRVTPVVQGLRLRRPDAIISLDTTKVHVLRMAKDADIINSVWGASSDLLEAAVELNKAIVIMHNQETSEYEDVVGEVIASLSRQAEKAIAFGIKPQNIILDPGIGFAKTAEHNLQLMSNLDRLVALGFPTLIGTSRKSFIGKLTNKAVQERAFGTAATVAMAIAAGIDIVRVHDVIAMRDVIAVSDAIVRGTRPDNWSSLL